MTSDTCELRRLAVTFALVTAGLVSGISLSLFARLRGRNVKIAIVYVESTLALEENFASDCRAELRNTIDADVAVFWLEVFGGHAEKRVDFMLGSLSDFPGRVGMFPAFDLRAEPGRQSSSSDGPVALRCESERVISSVTNYLSRADISSIRTIRAIPENAPMTVSFNENLFDVLRCL